MFGVGAGQVVCLQVAVALVVAATGQGALTVVAAILGAGLLTGSALVRVRGRWAYAWAGTALRYAGRRHGLPPTAEPAALLDLLAPGTRVLPASLAGEPAALISDGFGLAAVIELGDPTGLLAEPLPALPSPVALLPAPGPDNPPTLVQLVLTGVPAPALRAGSGTSATSYRQLTEGRLLGHARAVLVVRVQRAEGWTDDELRRTLSGLVRKLPRRLGGVPARPLGEAAALRVLLELAHHAPGQPVRETWSALHLGGLVQATYRLRRWPDLRVETTRRLVTRL
ncbi:MAG TPA: type VII secretion protein EccE, partial [Catenuloplanes sp.]